MISGIDFKAGMGFNNIILHIDINNLKDRRRLEPDYETVDVDAVFNNWLDSLIILRKHYPRANVFISPILPTRIRALNSRACHFNHLLTSCVNPFWRVLNFVSFLDNDDLLDQNYCREQNMTTGYKDRIHLGYLGISGLCQLFRHCIIKPPFSSSFSYASGARSQAEQLNNSPIST